MSHKSQEYLQALLHGDESRLYSKVYSETEIYLFRMEKIRALVMERSDKLVEVSDRYSNYSLGYEATTTLADFARQNGSTKEAKAYQKEADEYLKKMVAVRQEACEHEFIRGQKVCCRCGIEKTAKLEKIVNERNEAKERKKRKVWKP